MTVKNGTWAELPEGTTAILLFSDGTIYPGVGFGATGHRVGELCFNTSVTGYQEIMTDPSYAGQIITFTAPHIGNVGTNKIDMERDAPAALGLVVREHPTLPDNYRSELNLNDWSLIQGLIGLSGVDTRSLTHRIRAMKAPTVVIAHDPDGQFDLDSLLHQAQTWPGLAGMDLAQKVTSSANRSWTAAYPRLEEQTSQTIMDSAPHVVAIDYGAKDAIMGGLVSAGFRVTRVSAMATFDEIIALDPDGIFLSNGPGDPAATGLYALPVIKQLITQNIPVFGICLGHQLLALALNGQTYKMDQGHRGANHPVKDMNTGQVQITSMNHGFSVAADSLPKDVTISHISLFDGSVCGLQHKTKPIFSVQHHPEASPGPRDSLPLFAQFIQLVQEVKNA